MPHYAYRAVHTSGRIARGHRNAANENELAHDLNEAGMELIEAREKTDKRRLSFTRGVPPRVLAAFCSRMRDLLQAGISFPDALRDVTGTTENPALREVLIHAAQNLANGGGIAASFALYPRLFPPVFTAILGAGENSGSMQDAFDHLARYGEAQAQTQERLRRALRYPLFLFLVAGSAVTFMLLTVVPQMVQFLNGIQGHLPFSTRLLVTLSQAFSVYGIWFGSGAFCTVCTVFIGRAVSPVFALFCDDIILGLPFMGAVITKTSLARFAQSFALLFRSGCDVPNCLRQARDTISNRALRAGVLAAEQRVIEGSSLSLALEGVWPNFALGLLRTGERSNNLGRSLDDIAVTYDREAQAATDAFIGALEPALTLAIGALLVWTVLAVLGPLYGSLSVLGGRM